MSLFNNYLTLTITLVMTIFLTTNSANGSEDFNSMTNELSEHGTNGSEVLCGQYSSHFFYINTHA